MKMSKQKLKSFFINRRNILIICAAIVASAAICTTAVILLKNGMRSDTEKKPAASVSTESSGAEKTVSEPEKEPELVITSPEKTEITTTYSKISFTGTSDPKHPLTFNGGDVERNENGEFAFEASLNQGKNIFTFEHKGKKQVYTVTYKYVIINAVYPSVKQQLNAGTTFGVTVSARPGSRVSAQFNGNTVILAAVHAENTSDPEPEFIDYSGQFTLPTGNENDVNLGKILFTAELNGAKDTSYSGSIICKKDSLVSSSTYIAEIVAYSAETFNGNTADDFSNPTFNYLPQGTVDYCDKGVVYDSISKNTYYKLRFGRRVYTEKKNPPATGKTTVTKRYAGTLPDHNEIAFNELKNTGSHTTISFSTMWKAPFIFELKEQSYTDPASRDYTISAETYSYIDIKFCYSTVFAGMPAFPEDNPLFSSSTLINSEDGYILRLNLKQTGKFYGWDCKYDENGDLVFSFLNPKAAKPGTNQYAADLSGIKILIDVGHGGADSGAPGINPNAHNEAERNLNLALKLKSQLELTGATVVMTRYDNSSVTADRRCQILKEEQPDLCIAIHHDSNKSPVANGYSTYYSTPFSASAATFVNTSVYNANIYNSIWNIRWHYFFTARMTACPVVLTENGFISNSTDYEGIADETVNEKKATAIARGIVNYFNSIS